MQPAIGRAFAERDDRPGSELAAIVTHDFWRRELGGTPAALGRTLTLDGAAYTVVGVLPAGFRYLRDYDVFVAMAAFSGTAQLLERGNHGGYVGLGRLKTGVSREAATRELQAIEADITREHPDVAAGLAIAVEALADRLVNDVQRTLLVLAGAVGMLLLIACANVANLLIARGAARRHELSIRSALGARRTRLAAQLLVESTLLSGFGGACGVLLSIGLLKVLLAFAPPDIPRLDEVRLDALALLFALGAATACGILFGALPAAQGSAISGDAVPAADPRGGSVFALAPPAAGPAGGGGRARAGPAHRRRPHGADVEQPDGDRSGLSRGSPDHPQPVHARHTVDPRKAYGVRRRPDLACRCAAGDHERGARRVARH